MSLGNLLPILATIEADAIARVFYDALGVDDTKWDDTPDGHREVWVEIAKRANEARQAAVNEYALSPAFAKMFSALQAGTAS
jgi:hypothetical protein